MSTRIKAYDVYCKIANSLWCCKSITAAASSSCEEKGSLYIYRMLEGAYRTTHYLISVFVMACFIPLLPFGREFSFENTSNNRNIIIAI
jgi:hypothetical protein